SSRRAPCVCPRAAGADCRLLRLLWNGIGWTDDFHRTLWAGLDDPSGQRFQRRGDGDRHPEGRGEAVLVGPEKFRRVRVAASVTAASVSVNKQFHSLYSTLQGVN